MSTLEWAPAHSLLVYLGAGTLLVLFALVARRCARFPSAARWTLLVLRLLVFSFLFLLLLNPVRVTETHLPPRPAEVVYLIDTSRSMALDRPWSRLEQVKRAIGGAASKLTGECGPHVNMFRFGRQLAAESDVASLIPDDDVTLLHEILERLPARFPAGRPAGVVVFSDGRSTEEGTLDDVAAGFRRMGVPVHVYPVGDERTIGDIALQEVIAPRDVPIGSRWPIRIVVRSTGYANQRAVLSISSASEPTRQSLASLPITLADGVQPYELTLDQLPVTGQLVAALPKLEGEATHDNNQIAFQVAARRAKIRVIYMEGTTGGNEYAYIHNALVEDPNIECLSMLVDNQYAARPRLHRVSDPARGFPTTREELFSYDLVICSDINKTAFSQQQLDWVVELVAERGGGFVMIGGNTSFGAGNWDATAWDKLIPVDMTGVANSPGRGTCWGVDFRAQVPTEAETHPIWRMVDDPARNRAILDRIPSFKGTNLIERLKPAATPLAYSDQPIQSVGRMVIFAAERYGKGRTFAMAPDSTVDWGYNFERFWGEGDNRYFRKFWRNVAYWLTENSIANRKLKVETDKLIYRPEEPIRISARAFDDKFEETTALKLSARLRTPGGPGNATYLQEIDLSARANDKTYEGTMTSPPLTKVPLTVTNATAPLRLLTLEISAQDRDKVVAQTTLDVQLLDDPVEFHDPGPDAGQLARLAQDSGGQVLRNGNDLARLLESYSTTAGELIVQRTPLWDHPLLWGLLLALLTLDWCLRRWWGLG